MALALNHNKLQQLIGAPFPGRSPHELCRRETVFLIGGNLPVYETLETMYESYCLESTDLFHITFAGRDDLERNLELVHQVKKNFPVRLMGRIAWEITAPIAEQAYLAGLDILDLPWAPGGSGAAGHDDRQAVLGHAAGIFPRWSTVSSLDPGSATAEQMRAAIDSLLAAGVVPLPTVTTGTEVLDRDAAGVTYEYLLAAWQRHEVLIKPLLPLIRLVTPLDSAEPAGFLRSVINRIQDRHHLATSDLRRHLRTSGAEASFESAGL
ncbi:MAG TPA: hypothetical protein VIH45_12570 [Desulfuromonadaceae bacterium]